MSGFIASRRLILGLVFSAFAAAPLPAAAQETVTVFAAASLTNALQDIAKAYEAQGSKGGNKDSIKFSFAASSALAKQMEAGAPANIFASADLKWMDYTDGKGLTLPATRVKLLGNELVLVAPADKAKPVTISKSLDVDALLGPNGRIATGLTDSVPVGVYTKQAFTNLGLWDKIAPRIVGAESVRAALALVERGEVPYGVVYATDAAIAKNVKVVATFPADSYPPVDYPFALVKGQDTPAAKAFFAFVQSPEAKAIFKKYGFSVN
ncbi:molybdate transport system substrate-binding protein [Xanthobacter flavus]|uniref:Molybdate ABC transporter substrate-binding protein n=1 Tax=Xanthobacter flavus TaxID=281 RepID=A0A9W6CLW3_XANFL|nr:MULTISPECIES: molybdate ABC transporter substrate-binding protein [Xanthobacter]MDR6334077.1 molybdate transport system substrate-binding protein [Xanthobacter flavus]UDQ87389.1 molybdate ABC transporter substrate-binding protein [Xanthobacter autotrophicus]GLI22795.1 molybdate ABC transporter substrate-binding protein [Xanthobacter flavus]